MKNNCQDFHVNLFGNIASGFPEFKVEFLEFLHKYQGLVTHHGKYEQAEIPDLIQLKRLGNCSFCMVGKFSFGYSRSVYA